ncbi:T6SS phospholipase effector Tle1-like catalytic domain-containing protein [Aliivibrio logei]|uniref:T6SS Phospholipase effector Tle1-like catalytic domain-containing protein n=1 Tax=Aliivibrio logei 5S-186 TaxID=626086 RepID=A0ABX3AYX1_ALILO|nr:DUF2235 domain-containing protein [Aliivibrio logei]OEF19674.1 hypothetical protein A1Q5_04385 [Aliivibrio logei 5S-186]
MSDRCVPCEKENHWIELDFRDENNKPYKGIEITIEDAVGGVQTVRLKAGINVIENIASGLVKISMEPQALIDLVENRAMRNKSEMSSVIDSSKDELGGPEKDTVKEYKHVTLGDLWGEGPEYQLPKEHDKGHLGNVSFFHNESYVIEIQDFTKQEIRFGVFFDGTGNNSFNADFGAQCADQGFVPDENEDICAELNEYSKKARGSYDNSITNIGRLYDKYKIIEQKSYRIYMSGVGTKAQEEDERFPDMGLGIGDLGVISISDKAIDDLLFELNKLEFNRNTMSLVFDIFGFSRGAATARHFANEINKKEMGLLYEKLKLDIFTRVNINFIGLFDTVAAIGCMRDLLDTTDENNHGVNLYLPKNIAKKVIQITAHHECRDNFALNSVAPEHQEFALLGVHSDIGGGYRDLNDDVLIMKPYIQNYNRSDQISVRKFRQIAEQRIDDTKKEFLPYVLSSNNFSENNITKMVMTNNHYKYKAMLSMKRKISPDLQLLAFKLMHKIGLEYNVPFSVDTLVLDGNLQKLYSYYESISNQPTELSGLSVINNIPTSLSSSILKQYVHCSDHWALDTGLYTMKPRINNNGERERKVWPHKKQVGYPF